jgi:catechol 2,3-dioxygenase-like lactoylglutathione lyase family enzyme
MDPSSLDVDGERDRVEAAVAEYGGTILFTTLGGHHVRFPVDDPTALDRIKDALMAAGFEVRYSLILEL